MKLNDILYDYGKYAELREAVKSSPVSVSGVEESARAQLIFSLFEEQEKNALIVCYSDMEARALADDLAFYTDSVQFFPSKEYIFYNIETSGRTSQNERLAALYGIVSGKCITVASLDALLQYTIPKPELEEASIRFELGKRFDIDRLCEELIVMGYSREELVEGEGQFALRGGILDVFSPNCGNPLRIEFFDDETDSIRLFDRVSQRSLDKTDSADIIPVREAVITDERRGSLAAEIKSRIEKAKKRGGCEYYIETASAELESLEENRYFPSLDKYVSLIYGGNIPSLLDYFGGGSLIFVIDPKRICDRGKTFEWEKGEIVSELKEKNVIGPEKDSFFVSYGDALNKMLGNRVVSLETLTHTSNDFKYKSLISFTTKTTVSFHGKMDYLFDDVKKWQENGYTVVILAATRGRGENLAGVPPSGLNSGLAQ